MNKHNLLYLILSLYFYFLVSVSSSGPEAVFYLLCKSCGHQVAVSSDLIFKKSPFTLQTRNDSSLFHSHDHHELEKYQREPNATFAMVQLLRNPHGVNFELITLRQATLLLINETESLEDTWFPNFKWTVALCPQCRTHLGWFFRSIYDKESFVAIIMDKLLNSRYAESLVIEPKLKLF